MAKIEQLKAATRSGVLAIEEHDRDMLREVDVRRIDFTADPISNAIATFSILFEAEDPLLYGSESQYLPQNVVTNVQNFGDAPRCYPILEWSGATTRPGVNFGRIEWRLDVQTGPNDHMLVDCRNGAVFKNGSRIFPDWTGPWPYIYGNDTFPFTTFGAPMTIRRKSAWS